MRRLITTLILCGASAASIAACDDGRWGYYGNRNGGYRPYSCEEFTSCGSCTPVAGCGWCSFAGRGVCVSDPDDCNVTQFSFTWEPTGCSEASGATNDGGLVSKDGGASVDASAPPAITRPEAGAPADARADAPASDARADR